MFVTRLSLFDLVTKAKHEMEPDPGDNLTVAQALTHYLNTVPGTWRLVAVVADGETREFYWVES